MGMKPMSPYQIILADDHLMFRNGLKRIIEDAQNLLVLGEASDGLQLLELLKKTKPDMVILDISMPNLRGLEVTREIKTGYPDIKILILTMHRNKEYLLQALSAKADGYLLKYDLVFTDFDMPGIDGLTLAFHIKEYSPDTMVILMTGHDRESILGLIKDSAVDVTLFKPFDLEVILQILKETRTQPEHKLLSASC